MPEERHDELADALARLSGGQDSDSDDPQNDPTDPVEDHAEATEAAALPPEPPTPSSHRRVPDVMLPGSPQRTAFNARRTMIPILLTLGVLFPALGVAAFLVDQDSPLSQLRGSWVVITLLIVGPILLFFGVLNMLQVKNILQDAERASG